MPDTAPPGARRAVLTRAILIWAALGVLLVAALFSAIGALNREVYSAGGFVRSYLDALAHHDAAGALAMPGVDSTPAELRAAGLPADVSRELLRGSVLGSIRDIRVAEKDLGGGRRRVIAGYLLDSAPKSSTFTLEQTGSYLGVFPTWRFAHSPLGIASVRVAHADTFTVAGLTLDPRATEPKQTDPRQTDPGQMASKPGSAYAAEADYLVFEPARYTFGHSSALLTATPKTAWFTSGGLGSSASAVVPITVDARANGAFVRAVKARVNRLLDDCARQKVLQPAGCPFGTEIDDRVEDSPTWSIVAYPTIAIVPGDTGWQTPELEGVAHIVVNVRSLFDGTVSRLDRDEPFAISLRITLGAHDSVSIAAR